MARARLAKHPLPVEPEEILQEEPEPANDKPTMSKADMVRAGLAEGLTKPGDIAEFIQSRFGVDIPKPMVSSYAAQERARQRKASGEEYTPRSRNSASPVATIPASFGSDIKQVKQLIEQAGGGEALKELANSLAALQQRYGSSGLDSLIDAFE